MNVKEEEKRQRELIKTFDAELFTYTGQVAWFLPGMFSFLLFVFVILPVQEYIEDGYGFLGGMLVLAAYLPQLILMPYLDTTDSFTRRKGKSATFAKLQYLPVSRKQYNRVRLEYLVNYLWKLTAIGFVLQNIAAVIAYRSISPINLVYPIALLFVAPLAFGWLAIVTSK